MDYFKWRQLIGSIPISWKQLINEDAGSSRDNASTEQHFLQLTRQLVIDRMSSKQIYVILIKQLKRKPKSEQTIQTLIENNDINWEKSYSLGSEITVDTFGRSFCFKLTHNILYLNKILAQMGKHDTPLCSFCGGVDETIIHLFARCRVICNLWREIQVHYQDRIALPDLTPQSAFLGFPNLEELKVIINHILLIFKIAIYMYKSRDRRYCSINYVLNKISLIKNIEFQITSQNDKKKEYNRNKWAILDD